MSDQAGHGIDGFLNVMFFNQQLIVGDHPLIPRIDQMIQRLVERAFRYPRKARKLLVAKSAEAFGNV